jgi:preprotein translocase subunit SecA
MDLKDEALEMVTGTITETVEAFVPDGSYPEQWDVEGLEAALQALYPTTLTKEEVAERLSAPDVQALVLDDALNAYEAKEQEIGLDADGKPVLRELERVVLLSITDTKWREHLYEMDYLQEGIGLRAYGQKDPLVEFQRDAYGMFGEMKQAIQGEFVQYIYRVQLVRQEEAQRPKPQVKGVQTHHGDVESDTGGGAASGAGSVLSDPGDWSKTPRNAPCPCGSGRKFKKCHGATV